MVPDCAGCAAVQKRATPDRFVFDIQTHHVAAPRQFPFLLGLRRIGRVWNRALEKDRGTMEDLYLENFIKEVFLDSDTTVAMISGIPSASEAGNILPPAKMAETKHRRLKYVEPIPRQVARVTAIG